MLTEWWWIWEVSQGTSENSVIVVIIHFLQENLFNQREDCVSSRLSGQQRKPGDGNAVNFSQLFSGIAKSDFPEDAPRKEVSLLQTDTYTNVLNI